MACLPIGKLGAGSAWKSAGLSLLLLIPMARAQGNARGPFAPWIGQMGITQTMTQILARDAKAPALDAQGPRYAGARSTRGRLPQSPRAPQVPQWPWNFSGRNPPTMLPGRALDSPQTVSPTQNFLGATLLETPGFIPPDTTGAVGPAQFMVCVNGRLKAFDKATGAVVFSVDADAFFDPVRVGFATRHPNVRYDAISQRWFLTVTTTASAGNRVLIARSDAPTLTTSSAFTFFFFQQDAVAPTGNIGQVLDAPSLGIDAGALYIGGNMLAAGVFVNTSAWVVNKASVLGPGPIMATAFRNLLIANVGPYAPRGVDNPDPGATEGYFIGVDNAAFGLLQLRRITNPGGAPSISPNIPLIVPATTFPVDVATSGGWPAADAVDDRLFAAQIRKNRLTGQSSLTTAHNIQVSAAGVASSTGGRNGSRWYQIGSLGATPVLLQAGTLFDPAPATPKSYWIPSIAMTGQGHLAIGCSSAASNIMIGCSAAGRLGTDPPGTTQAASPIIGGAGTYINNGGRFGESSATVVDPEDDQSVWTFQEYMSDNGVWGIRAAKLLAPPPATPIAATPPAVAIGQTQVPIIITGAAALGSGFYDTAPGVNRLRAAFSGAGITVTNIAFSDPTHITLTVDVGPAASIGGRNLTVTNPDGQQTSSAAAVLTVSACWANCDGSTTAPILNIADFACFLNAYAAGTGYANCDNSTTPPILNILDFSCFLNAFAAGCP